MMLAAAEPVRLGPTQRGRIDVDEVADGDPSAGSCVGIAEIDRGRSLQHQGIVAAAAVDAVFSSAIGDAGHRRHRL